MSKTTLKKLIKDKCYCIKKEKDIDLKDCVLFNCNRWKKCKSKTNADIDKEIKKRDKDGKKK